MSPFVKRLFPQPIRVYNIASSLEIERSKTCFKSNSDFNWVDLILMFVKDPKKILCRMKLYELERIWNLTREQTTIKKVGDENRFEAES